MSYRAGSALTGRVAPVRPRVRNFSAPAARDGVAGDSGRGGGARGHRRGGLGGADPGGGAPGAAGGGG
jgi:hypothetical protein